MKDLYETKRRLAVKIQVEQRVRNREENEQKNVIKIL